MVLAQNSQGKSMILQGKAIGFGRKKGEKIDPKAVERIFVPNDRNEISRYQQFFTALPCEYWEAAEQIMQYAQETCDLKLNVKVMLPLCDHILGAVERYQKGVILNNPMLLDIKRLYPVEFKVGEFALKIIKQRFHIQMQEDEAAFLAFHFVYAQMSGGSQNDIDAITKLIGQMVEMIQLCFQIKLDQSSWDYQRFVTHIKFFAQRMFEGKQCQGSEDNLFHLIRQQYPRAYHCIVKVADFIHDEYHYELNSEEMLYLMIHIEKITRTL